MFNQNQQNNLFANNTTFGSNEQNFFSTVNPIIEDEKVDKQKWINDLDSSLILENIDNTAHNKVVKINLKLKTLNSTLEKIDEELKVLQLFNLDKDKNKRDELQSLKTNITAKIKALKNEKKRFGFFYILAAYTNDKITYENFKDASDKSLNFILKLLSIIKQYIKSKNSF